MTRIKLQYPITVDGKEVGEIALRRPKVRDMITVDKAGGSDAEKEMRTFCNLCELAPESIEEMDMADYKALQEAYLGFLS